MSETSESGKKAGERFQSILRRGGHMHVAPDIYDLMKRGGGDAGAIISEFGGTAVHRSPALSAGSMAAILGDEVVVIAVGGAA